MKVSRIFTLLVCLTLSACGRYPNEFKNVQSTAPHSILRGTYYPGGAHAFASQINNQPTAFWRWNDVFRIPHGSNNCRIAYTGQIETIGYKTAHFVAKPGNEYVIARKREPGFAPPFTATPHPTTTNSWLIHDWRDRATIQEINSSSTNIVADVPKQGYVFGLLSSNLAIQEYRQKNP